MQYFRNCFGIGVKIIKLIFKTGNFNNFNEKYYNINYDYYINHDLYYINYIILIFFANNSSMHIKKTWFKNMNDSCVISFLQINSWNEKTMRSTMRNRENNTRDNDADPSISYPERQIFFAVFHAPHKFKIWGSLVFSIFTLYVLFVKVMGTSKTIYCTLSVCVWLFSIYIFKGRYPSILNFTDSFM